MTIKPAADIVSRVVIPYDGTETASSAALTPQTPSTYMANLMA